MLPVNAEILFAPISPPIDIVVFHHVELSQKFGRRSLWLRSNVIARCCNRPRRIFFMEQSNQFGDCLYSVAGVLVGDLVSRTPNNDGRMIPVTPNHVAGISSP